MRFCAIFWKQGEVKKKNRVFMRNLYTLHPLYCCFLSLSTESSQLLKDNTVFYFGRNRMHLVARNVKCICSSQEVFFYVSVHTEFFYLQGVFCLH